MKLAVMTIKEENADVQSGRFTIIETTLHVLKALSALAKGKLLEDAKK